MTEALALAMASDCSSGGCIRLYTVDNDGSHYKYISGDKVPYPDFGGENGGLSSVTARVAGMVVG